MFFSEENTEVEINKKVDIKTSLNLFNFKNINTGGYLVYYFFSTIKIVRKN